MAPAPLNGSVQLDVMPAIGKHVAMTREQCQLILAEDVPCEQIIRHSWCDDLTQLGDLFVVEKENYQGVDFMNRCGLRSASGRPIVFTI